MVRKFLVRYGLAGCVVLAGCVGERPAGLSEEGMVVKMGPAPGLPGATLVECRATPRALEIREAMDRDRVAAIKRALQEEKPQAEVCVHFYYMQLDRSLKNGPGLRTGYWPQGRYFYCYPIEGAELAQLRCALEQLEAVPRQGRPQSIIRRNDAAWNRERGDFSHAYLELRLDGRSSFGVHLDDPKASVVKKSQESALMQQMSPDDWRYSLPDAAYEALLALPSLRHAYAALKKYRKSPAPFFKSEEEEVSRSRVSRLHHVLPMAKDARLMLDMYYPQGERPLLAPRYSPRYRAEIVLGAEELAELRGILSRLETVPMRYMVPFTAPPRDRDEMTAMLSLGVAAAGDDPVVLGDIGRSIIRRSEQRKVASRMDGDCVHYLLPDADYAALMALPSVRRAMEWSRQYKDAPADFFTRYE